MVNQFFKFGIFFLLCGLMIFSSCNKRRYPCPGNGQSSSSSLSKFDEDGNLKNSKRKRVTKNERGLVNKKQNARLRRKRKTSLGDKPKNLKK